MLEVRVADDDDARLKHVAHLYAFLTFLALSQYQLRGLEGGGVLHLELLHIVDVEIWGPDFGQIPQYDLKLKVKRLSCL